MKRTLSAVVGVWGQFHYLASLRLGAGRYEHWGLMRTHGESSAQAALAEAHTALFSRILRTPLSELLRDIELTSRALNISTEEFIAGILRHAEQLAPKNLGGGNLRHFNSVLEALSSVHAARRSLSHRAA